jgi:hypothetical protein
MKILRGMMWPVSGNICSLLFEMCLPPIQTTSYNLRQRFTQHGLIFHD